MTEILGLDTGTNLILRVSSDVSCVIVEAREELKAPLLVLPHMLVAMRSEVCLQHLAKEDNCYSHNLSVCACNVHV